MKTFFHGHSYTGNPLACAAALASIDIFDKDATLQNMSQKSGILYNKLLELSGLKHVGDVRCKGLVAAVELVKDKVSREPFHWEERIGWQVAYKMRDYGVVMRPLGNTMVVMPPLVISETELNHLMDALKQAVVSVTE
jgi:adenosylmethionine-8-amino-7-oxononanoate aminotransferase